MAKGKLTDKDYERAGLLVSEAIAEHNKVAEADQSMLEHAFAAGAKLLDAKVIFGSQDRKWTKWLGENCSAFSQATAYRYMDLARYRDKILTREKNGDAETSIRWATELIRQFKEEELTEEERKTKEAARQAQAKARARIDTGELGGVLANEPARGLTITALKNTFKDPVDRREISRAMDDAPPPDLKATLSAVSVDDALNALAVWDTDNLKALALGISRIVDERKLKAA
jgi:hypothetical protein